MQPKFRQEIGTMLPDDLPYPYFPAREGAWLLTHRLPGPARLSALRRGPLAPLLAREGVRHIAAQCGDGWLTPQRLLPLADPLAAFGRERELMGDRATEAAYDLACAEDWLQFTVSFANWCDDEGTRNWRELQLSRRGSNLVLQLNFPKRYAEEFLRLFCDHKRLTLEWRGHPVRTDETITLAWARLDFEPWGQDLLIEEVQTDWLRNARTMLARAQARAPHRPPRVQAAFLEATLASYQRIWARALLLAVLAFAVRELGMSRIWLHQPETGARLKNIRGALPPRSLYTELPRRFGFQPTDRAPQFLYQSRSRVLAKLRRSGRPLFWLLRLGETVTTG